MNRRERLHRRMQWISSEKGKLFPVSTSIPMKAEDSEGIESSKGLYFVCEGDQSALLRQHSDELRVSNYDDSGEETIRIRITLLDDPDYDAASSKTVFRAIEGKIEKQLG